MKPGARTTVLLGLLIAASWMPSTSRADPASADAAPELTHRISSGRTMLVLPHAGAPEDVATTAARLLAWMQERKVALMGPVVIVYPAAGERPEVHAPVDPAAPPGAPRLAGTRVVRTAPTWTAVSRMTGPASELAAAWRAHHARLPASVRATRPERHEVRLVDGPDGRPRFELRTVLPSPERADVALYVGPGAGPAAIEAASSAVDAAGLTQRPLSAAALRQGAIEAKVVLVPGGWSPSMRLILGDEGQLALRAHVRGGGGYVGICAGAWLVCQRVVWEEATSHYPRSLLDLEAHGPLADVPWPTRASIEIELEPHLAKTLGTPRSRRVLYWGGGWFGGKRGKLPRGFTALATYGGSKRVAALRGRVGQGRVFLTGPHFEFDLTSDRDGHAWPESVETLPDAEPDWDVFHEGLRFALGGLR